MNMKKVLIAGAVLTAFATSAFAAEVQENCKPSMKDRVNKILCENDQQPGYHKKAKKGFPERPRMTEEQREAFKKMNPEQRKAFMKERHEQWIKSMTPEQKARFEQHHKKMQERMQAHKKLVDEKMNKLTKAQRAEVEQFIKDDMAQRKAMGERLKNMTPEQREAIRVSRPNRFGHPGYKHFDKKDFGKKGPGPKMHRGPQHDGMFRGPVDCPPPGAPCPPPSAPCAK